MIGAGVAPLAIGLSASLLALALAAVETRYVVAVLALVGVFDGLLLLGSWQRVRAIMVGGLALGLSLGVGISFFLHTAVEGSYVPFVGGAEGVTLSLSLLAALIYAMARLADPTRQPWRLCGALIWPQLLFMAVGLLSVLNATYPLFSLLEELRLLCLLGLCIVVMNLAEAEMLIYQRVLAASIMLQAAVVALQWTTGHSLGLSILGEGLLIEQTMNSGMVARPVGTLPDPNIASYFFEITGPAMLLLTFAARPGPTRLLFAAATLAAWIGTFLTLSRGAWLALPLCSGLAVVCFLGRRLLRPSVLVPLGAVALLACAAIAVAWPFLAERLFGDDGGSTGHRLPLLAAAWQVLANHPWLGIGLNNFALTLQHDDQTGYFRIFPHLAQVVHNLHVLVWTEVGTLGLIPYLLLFAAAGRAAFLVRHENDAVRALAFGAAFGLLAHFLHGFVDPGFKLNLVISQLVNAQIGVLGWLQLRYRRSH